ncbi:efflux RND transporter permease subunit [Caenimonas soli]|uniref:efflux RND transporter permease subunit n=1 Tax=Caenimonas soli TaxID=2735555 RepID=UPI001551ACB4|nr:MMPL family transporter [Caenimonas soli]NPC55915.1 RND family transporter [Caenimonas soli]
MIAGTQNPMSDAEDFDPKTGSLVERALFNHRAVVVFICLLLSILFGLQASKLTLNAGFEKMIPARHPFVQNYAAHKSELAGLGNTLRIAVEHTGGTIFEDQYLQTLRKISDELFLMPGVDRPYVKSLWTSSTRWIGVNEEGLIGGTVMPQDYDGSPSSIDALRTNVLRSGQVGQLVALDFKSSVIMLPLLDRDRNGVRLRYEDFAKKLELVRQKYESDSIRIHVTGFAKVVGDLIEGLQQVLWFLALAIAICAAVLYWHTRCIRSTALLVLCSLVAVVWLLGLLPTLGFELDPYSILIPFLVFAIGMSHGAQKMNGIMQDIGRGLDKRVAARFTFRRLFLAGLTALLADAVGFAVLFVIDIPVIKDLAMTASLGVAILVFTNLVLLPVLLSYVGVSPVAARRSLSAECPPGQGDAKKHAFWAFLDKFTQRRWATVAVVTAAVLGLGGFVVSQQLRIGDLDPGAPELRADSRYNRDVAFMLSHYAASSDTYVVMAKTPEGKCSTYGAVAQMDALEWELQQLPGVEATNSLAQLTRVMTTALNEGSFKWYDVPRVQEVINATVVRAPRELFNQSCDLATVYVYLKDHRAETLESVVAVVEAFASKNNRPEQTFLSAAGNAGFEAATNIVVRDANRLMLVYVYLAVIALAYIAFRSWRAVLCAVLPLMLTTVLAEALMVVLGIGVKVATLPVVALGVGIGVDYALYVMTVTLALLRQGRSLSDAYYAALIFTGRVVVLTGLTLGAAVATWAFSPIKFQADMGILMAFMFIWNMLGALILLPALAHWLLQPAAARETQLAVAR